MGQEDGGDEGVEVVAIVGSRKYPQLERVKDYVKSLPDGILVVSGGADGVDIIAEVTALIRGLTVRRLPAEWEVYGKGAGFIRNQKIVDACDRLVAFWDGSSKGTADTLEKVRKSGKPYEVFLPFSQPEPQ